jgi:hypothetical protein
VQSRGSGLAVETGWGHMRSRTRVRTHGDPGVTSGFRAAASLHSHTNCSRENLEFLPYYALRIPIVKRFVRSELRGYEARTGWKADFSQAYWTPPVSPDDVLNSERAQIASLDLEPFVSITDHDTIEAGLKLTAAHPAGAIPISVEWTVPFGRSDIHLGVHNLPPTRAVEVMRELAAYTARPEASVLPELLERLHAMPETLVVLNHPLWDHRRVGQSNHRPSVLRFLSSFGPWIHALEISGLRTWRENRDVLALAEEFGLPSVAGGDRHGRQPNPVLNLTGAGTWSEYVSEIRQGFGNDILLMPKYWVSPKARDMEIAADALRHYHRHPYGQRRFIDRVFADIEGYGYHPLAFYWDGGIHLWVRVVTRGAVALGSPGGQRILNWLMSSSEHSRDTAVMTPTDGLTWELPAGGVPELRAMPAPAVQRSASAE